MKSFKETNTVEQEVAYAVSEGAQQNEVIGLQHPKLSNKEQVKFGALAVNEVRFQIRQFRANSYVQSIFQEQESTFAIQRLISAVEAGNSLDAIIVWNDPQDATETLWVIDGHHRMAALTESKTQPDCMVWVQRFKGDTEASARAFALEINKRTHINMSHAETQHALWMMLLCHEITGSVRELEKLYGIGKSSVSRMKVQIEPVRERLAKQAAEAGKPFDNAWIREHAPFWKTLAPWLEGGEADKPDIDALIQKKIDGFVRMFTLRFGDHVRAYPGEVREAFEQFYREAVGYSSEGEVIDENPDF